MIYLHEIYDIKPGKKRDFLNNVERHYLPIADKHRVTLVGFWETALTQGESSEAIALWELQDWAHLSRINEAQYPGRGQGDRELREWNTVLWQWVDKRHGKVLIPGKGSPTLAQLRERGVSAQQCVHETVTVAPNQQQAYLDALELLYYPSAHRTARRAMVGIYRTFWRNCENINIWALTDGWETLAMGDQQSGLNEEQPRETRHWMNAALSLRTDWHDRLLQAVPFSPL